MIKFVYQAKRDPLNRVTGAVMAENLKSAVEKLGHMGLFLIDIREDKAETQGLGGIKKYFFKPVKLRDVTRFTRQLSDLLEAGLTLVRALDLLQSQTENPKFKQVIHDVHDYCVDGHSLSSALQRYPRIFSTLFVSLVRSGEVSGALEHVLKRYSDFSEKQQDTESKIKSALAYPALMSVMGCITITVLVTFVIPKLMGMFEDFEHTLPIPTILLLALSRFLTQFGWLLILALVAGGWAFRNYYRTPAGRLWLDGAKMNLPVLGILVKKIEIARFTNTLATLLNNGLPILESLEVSCETVENEVIQREIRGVYQAVKGGASFSRGFGEHSVFPVVIQNMIAIGEESGQLDKTLFKLAEIYDKESDESIKTMVSLLEPILIMTLGLVVGFIVIAMLLPVFELSFLG